MAAVDWGGRHGVGFDAISQAASVESSPLSQQHFLIFIIVIVGHIDFIRLDSNNVFHFATVDVQQQLLLFNA